MHTVDLRNVVNRDKCRTWVARDVGLLRGADEAIILKGDRVGWRRIEVDTGDDNREAGASPYFGNEDVKVILVDAGCGWIKGIGFTLIPDEAAEEEGVAIGLDLGADILEEHHAAICKVPYRGVEPVVFKARSAKGTLEDGCVIGWAEDLIG